MFLKLVSVLILISISIADYTSSVTQQSKCGSCYSKAPSEFLSCVKDSCQKEILNKNTLFRIRPQTIKENECSSCYSKENTAFNSCVRAACSLLIVDKAIEVAVKNPFKLGKIAPIETTSCKVCLSQVGNSEQVSACYYSACKEELTKSALKEQSELTESNCGICSVYDNDEFKNCAIMFCKAESKAVLLEVYGEVVPSNKLCADLCYQRTVNSGSNFFDCSKELCGASTDIMQLFNQMQRAEGCNCDNCYYLFSGVSLKSCQEQYCESELTSSLEGKAKMFSVEPSYKSACSACNVQFEGDALTLCVIQECKKDFELALYENDNIKLSRCQEFCTYSYYDGYFTYNEWYDCYYYSCKEEALAIYSQQLATKQTLSVYCQACYQKYQTYGYEQLDFECTYCHQSALLDKRNLFGNLLDRNDKCGKCASEEGSFYLMCVNANCGSLLLKTSRDLALYEPTKLSGYICRDCSTVYEFGGEIREKDCWWYACKQEKVDKTSLMAQENLGVSCSVCDQYVGEVFDNCANWYCRRELDVNKERLSKEKCTAYFFELNRQSKKDFLQAVTANCLITENEANLFLMSNIKLDSRSWSELACLATCTDSVCTHCKDQQLKIVAEKLQVQVSELTTCNVCLNTKDKEAAKLCVSSVPACKSPSAYPTIAEVSKKFDGFSDLCISCSTMYDQSLLTFLELSNCQKQFCKNGVSSDIVHLKKETIISKSLSNSINLIRSSAELDHCLTCEDLYLDDQISYVEYDECSKAYCKEVTYIELTKTGCNQCNSDYLSGFLNNYEYGYCMGYFECKYSKDFSKLVVDTRVQTFEVKKDRAELEASLKLSSCSDCMKYWISGTYTDYQYGYCEGYYYCKAVKSETQLRNKFELVSKTDLCTECCSCNKMLYEGYLDFKTVELCYSYNTCKAEDKKISVYYNSAYCTKCINGYFNGGLTYDLYVQCYNSFCVYKVDEITTSLFSQIELSSSVDSKSNLYDASGALNADKAFDYIIANYKNEVLSQLVLNQQLVKKDEGIKLNHCSQCSWLYSEGYYTYTDYSYCYYWYCREEIIELGKVYLSEKVVEVKSEGSSYVSMAGITAAATLFVGLAYMAAKKRIEEDSTSQFSYKSML